MNYQNKVYLSLSLLLLTSCSMKNESTFILVCKGDENISMRIKLGTQEDFTEENEKTTRTYVFIDKVLEGYECTKFNDKEIDCQTYSKNDDRERYTESFNQVGISINRISGEIQSQQTNKFKQIGFEKYILNTFKGTCEKSSSNKI